MSVYAQEGSSGGSVYAQAGSSSGSVYAGKEGSAAPAKSGGGGILGTLERGAHWTAGKLGLAAHDIKGIPGGFIDLGKLEYNALKYDFQHPNLGQHESFHDFLHGSNNPASQKLGQAEAGMAKASAASVEHPLRDPFETALTVAPLVSGVGGIAARAGAAADAARAGEGASGVAKALASSPPVEPRLFTVGDKGESVSLHASTNPVVRAAQGLHDRIVQKAINEKPESRLASYGTKRLGGAIDETARYQQRMRDVPAQQLDAAAKRLAPTGGHVPGTTAKRFQRVEQAALELTSTNTPPEVAAAYHAAQAEKGINAPLNNVVSRLYKTVADRGLLTTNEHGDVIVNAADHPKLAETDIRLAKVQGRGDEILARYGVRTPEQLQEAINAPGRYRSGAAYETPTPAKLGVPSQGLLKARSSVDRLQALFDRADERVRQGDLSPDQQKLVAAATTPAGAEPNRLFEMAGHHEISPMGNIVTDGRVLAPHGSVLRDALGVRLSAAKDELQRQEAQHLARQKPVGIVGGETARPGRGHVSYASAEKKAPQTPAAASPGPIVGEVKAPISSHANQGVNISLGKVPNDITGQAARHYHQIVRFVNTSERRAQAIRAGTAVRRSTRDVLARVPGEEHGKINPAVEEILGKSKLTHDDVEGLHAALEAYKQDLIPGLRDNFAEDKKAGIGTPAPEGHVWVDRNLLGDLARPGTGPRGKVARSLDNINSAVTAATVYFKLGHIPTRGVTNAVTNLIQGSLDPLEMKKSFKLWDSLSEEDKLRALAASGQHGYAAMPHAGASRVSRVAGTGANFYARRFDAPFRFNSIAYEARKAGFDTPEKFREMLDKLENPHDYNMNAAEAAKVDWVAKRANRAQIAYDRLNRTERQYLSRGIWFLPWVKGATMFAGHTLLEHPYKAGVLGAAGVQGRKDQAAELGPVPSYEQGLAMLHGGAKPLVTDLSTFSPFATAGDLLNAAGRPGELSGFLNPANTALVNLITGQNQYGQKSTSPIKDALSALVAPTPEAQILSAYLGRKQDQSKRLFHKTPLNQLARSLAGPWLPRTVNPAALTSSAARERSGR